MAETRQFGGGFPVLSILGLIFITLKLLGEITWSWLWVLAPFWIPLAVVVAVFLIIGLVALIGTGFESHNARKRRQVYAKRRR